MKDRYNTFSLSNMLYAIPILVAISMLVALRLFDVKTAIVIIVCMISLFMMFRFDLRLFMLILLLPSSHAGIGIASLQGFGLFDILSIIFVVFYMGKFFFGENKSLSLPHAASAGFIMIFAFVPSIINVVDSFEMIKSFIQLILSVFMFTGVYYYVTRSRDTRFVLIVMQFLVIVAAIVSMYGLYEYSLLSSAMQLFGGRVSVPFFEEVNYYAGYLLMAFPLGLGFIIISKSYYKKILFIITSIFLFIGIISTVSRSAIVVLSIVLLIYTTYFLFQKRMSRWIGLSIFSCFMLVFVILLVSDVGNQVVNIFALSQRLETVVEGHDRSIGQRSEIQNVSFRMIETHPIIGVGLGNYEKAYNSYQGSSLATGSNRAAHNTALRIFAETGIVGGFFASIFILQVIITFIKGFKAIKISHHKLLAFSSAISILTFLLMSLTLDQLYEPHFWIILGLSFALIDMLRNGSENDQKLIIDKECNQPQMDAISYNP